MVIKGNKGEWSEIYAFMHLLATGKLFAADEYMNKIDSMFFPIIKIIRNETIGKHKEYYLGKDIRVCINGETVIEIPSERFSVEAESLLENIIKAKGSSLSFEETERFMKVFCAESLESRGRDKADIFIQIHDIQTGYSPEVGFSIKSKLGKPATLLNASNATNFLYEIIGDADTLDYVRNNLGEIQGVDKPSENNKSIGPKAILANLENLGCNLKFCNTDERFNDNLMLVDSNMSLILAEMLIVYYSGKAKNSLSNVITRVITNNPLNVKPEKSETYYTHKVKSLLCAVALGMLPSVEWNGTDEATGGYIVVKADGEVVAYHIYNRDKFKGYLLNNTKFEGPQRFPSKPPSKKKGFDYGYIYERDGKLFIKLNLQIRFA